MKCIVCYYNRIHDTDHWNIILVQPFNSNTIIFKIPDFDEMYAYWYDSGQYERKNKACTFKLHWDLHWRDELNFIPGQSPL